MITEHKNTGSESLVCRLNGEDLRRITAETDIAALDRQRLAEEVDSLADGLKTRKKDLADKEAEIFRKHAVKNKGEELRSVVFDEIHDHAAQRVFNRRQDTGALFGCRNMREEEVLQHHAGQGNLLGEDLEEPQDVDEITRMITDYLAAHPPEEPDEPPADADVPDDEPAAELDRVAAMRAEILNDFDADLDEPENVEALVAALGYVPPVNDGRFDLSDLPAWADNERRIRQGAAGQDLPFPASLATPPDGVDDIQTDGQLVAALIRPGYWCPPVDVADLGMGAWEELRHYAASAPDFIQPGQAPEDKPALLADYALDQFENLGPLLFILDYQILDADAEEYEEAVSWTDGQIVQVVRWAAEAYVNRAPRRRMIGEAADALLTAPDFLEPFEIAPEDPEEEPYADLVAMTPDELDQYLEGLAVAKDGLQDLRRIAQALGGDVEDYSGKARKTCVRDIKATIERQASDLEPGS